MESNAKLSEKVKELEEANQGYATEMSAMKSDALTLRDQYQEFKKNDKQKSEQLAKAMKELVEMQHQNSEVQRKMDITESEFTQFRIEHMTLKESYGKLIDSE